MAIRPQDLVKIQEDEKEAAGRLIQYINEKLRSTYNGSLSMSVGIRESVPYKVQQEVMRSYKQAGWNTVEFTHDQRDGLYISLSAEGPEQYEYHGPYGRGACFGE